MYSTSAVPIQCNAIPFSSAQYNPTQSSSAQLGLNPVHTDTIRVNSFQTNVVHGDATGWNPSRAVIRPSFIRSRCSSLRLEPNSTIPNFRYNWSCSDTDCESQSNYNPSSIATSVWIVEGSITASFPAPNSAIVRTANLENDADVGPNTPAAFQRTTLVPE